MPDIIKTDHMVGGWRIIGPEKDWRIVDSDRKVGEGKRQGLLVDTWKAHIEDKGFGGIEIHVS